MFEQPRNKFNAQARYQPILREIGLDAESVFTHPDIKVWRSITERENCTLDVKLKEGRTIRLHVKRYKPVRGVDSPAYDESLGIRALEMERIPTVPLVGWGKLVDGRSFVITEDLADYQDAEKMVERGLPFERILQSTADVAAKLHRVGLHHRDLYLCHFFIKVDDFADVRLIDAARVSRLPGWPMRQRWIIKDLAQFWYSTTRLHITPEQRGRWLSRYAEQRQIASVDSLRRSIERKSDWIARHDAKLNEKQKDRNVSIPPS